MSPLLRNLEQTVPATVVIAVGVFLLFVGAETKPHSIALAAAALLLGLCSICFGWAWLSVIHERATGVDPRWSFARFVEVLISMPTDPAKKAEPTKPELGQRSD